MRSRSSRFKRVRSGAFRVACWATWLTVVNRAPYRASRAPSPARCFSQGRCQISDCQILSVTVVIRSLRVTFFLFDIFSFAQSHREIKFHICVGSSEHHSTDTRTPMLLHRTTLALDRETLFTALRQT